MVSSINTKCKYELILSQLWAMIGPTNLQLQPQETLSIKLCHSQQQLHKIRKQASKKQQQFLNDLLVAAQKSKNKAHSKLIYGLRNSSTRLTRNKNYFPSTQSTCITHRGAVESHDDHDDFDDRPYLPPTISSSFDK